MYKNQNHLIGITLMLTAMLLFPAMDAAVKWLVIADIPSIQVIAVRSWIMIPIIVITLLIKGQLGQLRTTQPLTHIGRGLLGFIAPFTFFTALKELPLANATLVFFSSTFIMTALSALLLKEQVGIHRWGAVLVGFAGVVIAINPQQGGNLTGYLLVLCAAMIYAFLFLSGRQLTAKDSVISLVFSLNLMMGIVASIFLPWFWVEMSWETIAMTFVMTLIALVAHIVITAAFSRAQVSLLAPFEYTSLIWAAVIGYLVWGDFPSLNMWFGATIIVASGLYVIHRESIRKGID